MFVFFLILSRAALSRDYADRYTHPKKAAFVQGAKSTGDETLLFTDENIAVLYDYWLDAGPVPKSVTIVSTTGMFGKCACHLTKINFRGVSKCHTFFIIGTKRICNSAAETRTSCSAMKPVAV